ncbi:hypothetical protein OS493_016354 [Desmophyllum pertusum]|uniref:Receptor protein-tyrosine kinase n=1 Tax=Desmophyllum pertusum TaxID=174260 RepID=A0A9W9ZR08_9CNID|nr:hypothetical protein OS493_016354 [Desmophyllum pertusum]
MMKIACLAWMILLTCSNAFIDPRSGDKSCPEVNWKRALSQPGWANCSSGNYLNGLQRANNANLSATAFDGIDNIESGRCCIPPHEYKDETPVCQTVDWKTPLSGYGSSWPLATEWPRQEHKGYQDDVSLWSTKVTLDTWTHVVVTWEHVTGSVLIYADGKEIGKRLYPSRNKFFETTGNLYQIGNVGSGEGNNQFYGSVMDFYVFGTALSLDQINKLRGVPIIVNTTKAVTGRTVVVAWEPPLEGACPVVRYTVYYREVLSPAIKSKWHSPVTVNRNTTSYTLHLNCRKEYDIAVTSLNANTESALNDSKIWNFKTGGDVPSPPVINNKETKTLRCDVNLTWSPPADNGCPLTMYSIYYQQIQSRETGESWYQVNVSNHGNVMETNYTISLACDRQYTVEISAWNELGQSGRSRPWIIKTISDKNNAPTKVRSSRPSSSQLPRTTISQTNLDKSPASESGNGLSSSQLAGLVAGLGVLLIIIVMIIFSLRRKAQKNKQLAHNSRTRRSKSTIIPLWRWEVLREQVVFKEEIGRGAFGKVLKGIYKESPGIDVFYEPRTQIVDFKAGLTVAIKVLGDNTDEEARNQFLEEIELMKVIGSHRNIVSMLGCCVKSDPIFLLLEYVPYGDLQHWLRNKRIQVG